MTSLNRCFFLLAVPLLLTQLSCSKSGDPGTEGSTGKNMFGFPVQAECRLTRYNGIETYEYNSQGQLVKVTLDNDVATITYNAKGQMRVVNNFSTADKIELVYGTNDLLEKAYITDGGNKDTVTVSYPATRTVRIDFISGGQALAYATHEFNSEYDLVKSTLHGINPAHLYFEGSYTYHTNIKNPIAHSVDYVFLTLFFEGYYGENATALLSQHFVQSASMTDYSVSPATTLTFNTEILSQNAKGFPLTDTVKFTGHPDFNYGQLFEYSCD